MKNFKEMSAKELKELCKNNKIKGWYDMNKEQMIDALENEIQEEPEKSVVVKTTRDNSKRKQIEYNGKSQHICAWARELNMNANTLYNRIYKMGWTIEKAFETAPIKTKKFEKI